VTVEEIEVEIRQILNVSSDVLIGRQQTKNNNKWLALVV
jgi:hypothetical protein